MRLQLREWLFKLLEHNQTPGLEWVNREQKIFSISWRHGRKKGWKSEIDSQLFKEWAIYKKRYKAGNDRKNAKLWKSRFRCALNALSDVRELKTLSKTKGEDAKKIYQFFRPQLTTVKRRSFTTEENRKFAEFTIDAEEQCYNKIDLSQTIPYKDEFEEMEQPDSHGICADYHYMNSEEWKYIFYQTSQELYKFSHEFSELFCSLDEDDIEANQTIEELLRPKSHV